MSLSHFFLHYCDDDFIFVALFSGPANIYTNEMAAERSMAGKKNSIK